MESRSRPTADSTCPSSGGEAALLRRRDDRTIRAPKAVARHAIASRVPWSAPATGKLGTVGVTGTAGTAGTTGTTGTMGDGDGLIGTGGIGDSAETSTVSPSPL